MAFRTWVKLLGAAFGAAVLVGAGQLGLAYGLGILSFARVVDLTARDEWTAQLAWVAWFAMTAAAAGGVAARAHLPAEAGAGTRLAGGLAAGLGAAAIMPLTMQPARTAEIAGVNAVFVIGACSLIGASAGIFAAWAALSRSAARWSLLTLSGAIWVVALVSVAPSLRSGQTLSPVRLGVLDASLIPDRLVERLALLTMPAIALISGLVLGLAARNQRLSTTTIALAGLPGPALLTVAYLIAGPGSTRFQEVPYWAAMTAAGAGVFGSVLAAVLRRGPAPDRVGEPDTAEPTPDRPPLPQRQRDSETESAIAKAAAGPSPASPASGRASVQGRATVAAHAAVAAQRPENELKPSDTGVITMPPFDGFTPPAQQRPAGTDGEIADWVSGLGR